jgi:N-acetylglucosamine kinase-like BadF-type ATPase
MTFFVGVDGGQSSTVAVVGDADGELGRGIGPPADLVGKPRDPRLQAAAIGAAIEGARAAAGLPPRTRVAGLVAGISGFDRGAAIEPDLSSFADRSQAVHDTEIAHAGALAHGAGIVAIAGTGSVSLGNAVPGGAFVRAGGWGYFFGDEGGALWIARSALRRAMAREDCGESSDLRERALAYYGAFSLRAIQHAFAHGEITRPALAAFATEVLASASAGDADARAVCAQASAELAVLVATIDARLVPAVGSRSVSYAGGLFAHVAFVEAFRAAVVEAVPHADVVRPARDAAGGALVLARRLVLAAGP